MCGFGFCFQGEGFCVDFVVEGMVALVVTCAQVGRCCRGEQRENQHDGDKVS